LVTLWRYAEGMSPTFLARYVSPWALKRDKQLQQRVAALRTRDGDDCRRCRRAIRFDLPRGHDKGPSVEPVASAASVSAELDDLCLCHSRCNSAGADNTTEVTERIRRRNEAELLSSARGQRRRKA
jgi:hypothetical protein